MRALMLALMLLAGPVMAQPMPIYGPGSCPFDSSSCSVKPTGSTTSIKLSTFLAGPTYNPLANGAVCDGTTDDSAAFNALSTAIQNNGLGNGTIVQPPGKTCLISSANLTLRRGVHLQGVGQPMTANGGNPNAFVPFIKLSPSFSIVCAASSSISDMVIMRSGLAAKPASAEDIYTYIFTTIADSSIAINNNGSDCSIKNVQIIGFNKGVYSSGGARLIVEDLFCDTANCLEVTANADTSYINRVRGYPFWSFGSFNAHLLTYSGAVVAGGSGYVAGDTLTVPGGTCTTQPTFTSSGTGAVTALTVLDSGDCTVIPQTLGAVSATVYSGGSGGTVGTQTVTVSSGTCATAPQYSVTVAGGAITAVLGVVTPGSCTVLTQPPPQATVTGAGLSGAILNVVLGKNAISLTGGSGTGATGTISTIDAGYRPGTCLYLHDQFDGGKVDGVECQHYQTQVKLSNIWNTKLYYVGGEGGFDSSDKQTVGILTQNCVSDTFIYNPNSDANYLGLQLDHASAANGGSCGGAANQQASVTVIGGHVGFNPGISLAAIRTGASSTGLLSNITLGWQASSQASLNLAASSGAWQLNAIQFDGSPPTSFSQWVSVDPTATAPTSAQFASPGRGSMVLNGDMELDQFNEGASNSSLFRLDRWKQANQFGASGASQRSTNAPTGYASSLKFTIGGAVAPGAATSFTLFTQLEGPSINRLGWGAVAARPVVLDWCANASVTGIYNVALTNGSQARSYVTPFTISAANTWTCFSRVVPGDVTGTWTTTVGGVGAIVRFDLGSGANLQEPTPNSWGAGTYYSSAGSVQLSNNAAATFLIGAVHLRPGPFNVPSYAPRDYGAELSLVQRYQAKSFSSGVAVGQNKGLLGAVTMNTPFTSGSIGMQVQFPVPMALTPTVTMYSTSAATANCYDSTTAADVGAASAVNVGTPGFFLSCSLASGAPSANDRIQAHWWADSGF